MQVDQEMLFEIILVRPFPISCALARAEPY